MGINMGVCMCVCVCVCTQSRLILCGSMDCILPGPSVYGIFQARILEWVAVSSSRGSFQRRDCTQVSCVSCIGSRIFYHWATEKPWSLEFPKRKLQCHPLCMTMLLLRCQGKSGVGTHWYWCQMQLLFGPLMTSITCSWLKFWSLSEASMEKLA